MNVNKEIKTEANNQVDSHDNRLSVSPTCPPFSPPSNQPPTSEGANTLPVARSTTRTQKVFKCATCSRQFYRLLHLQRHEYTHTNYRPFGCAFCSKSFARQDSLVRHAKLHCSPQEKPLVSKRLVRHKACMSCPVDGQCERCAAHNSRANKRSKTSKVSPPSAMRTFTMRMPTTRTPTTRTPTTRTPTTRTPITRTPAKCTSPHLAHDSPEEEGKTPSQFTNPGWFQGTTQTPMVSDSAPNSSPLSTTWPLFADPWQGDGVQQHPTNTLFPAQPQSPHNDWGMTTSLPVARAVSVDQALLSASSMPVAPLSLGQLPGRLSVPTWTPTMTTNLSTLSHSTTSSLLSTPLPTPLDPTRNGVESLTGPTPPCTVPTQGETQETLLELLRTCQVLESSLRSDGVDT